MVSDLCWCLFSRILVLFALNVTNLRAFSEWNGHIKLSISNAIANGHLNLPIEPRISASQNSYQFNEVSEGL